MNKQKITPDSIVDAIEKTAQMMVRKYELYESVKQINGEFKVKDLRMQKYYLEIKKLIWETGLVVDFKHIRREQNKEADDLVNEILNNQK